MPASRREFLRAGGLVLAGLGFAPTRHALAASRTGAGRPLTDAMQVIRMRSDLLGAHVWFDPIGLFVAPGTVLRWQVSANVHTATAYHPRNDHHALRIPERATPWDSGFLVNPGDHFDITLTVPGVYDYYCAPHEAAGMVGRIIVGAAGGPGSQPFDYWVGKPGTAGWHHVPDAARKSLPSVQRIIAERRVHVTAAR